MLTSSVNNEILSDIHQDEISKLIYAEIGDIDRFPTPKHLQDFLQEYTNQVQKQKCQKGVI